MPGTETLPVGMAHIRTVSGQRFDPADPDPESISAPDIAHGLTHTCRFGGQGAEFYSVAQHSLNVRQAVTEVEDASPGAALRAPARRVRGISGRCAKTGQASVSGLLGVRAERDGGRVGLGRPACPRIGGRRFGAVGDRRYWRVRVRGERTAHRVQSRTVGRRAVRQRVLNLGSRRLEAGADAVRTRCGRPSFRG